MQRVEELLRDGKIKVKILVWKNKNGENIWGYVNYEEYMKLKEEQKIRIKIDWTDKTKTLFPRDWTDEDIAKAIKEAERLIKIQNNWKLAMKLDETTLIQYATEGGIYTTYDDFIETKLYTKFKEWWEIKFSDFWNEFNRYIYKYNLI